MEQRPNPQAPISADDFAAMKANGYNPVGVLKIAAELIATRGLARYVRLDENGKLCVHGAIALALGVPEEDNLENYEGEAYHAERMLTGGSGYSIGIADWNNDEDTTQQDVVDWLNERADYVSSLEIAA